MNNGYFDELVNQLIRLEDGYSNHPNDLGSETKFGISKRSYPNLDIKNLSESDAKHIYLTDYWNRHHLVALNDKAFVWELFKAVVNTNAVSVIRLVQAEYNAIGKQVLILDGQLGFKTIDALNSLTAKETSMLRNMLRLRLAEYYTKIVLNNRAQAVFLLGWLNRVLFR